MTGGFAALETGRPRNTRLSGYAFIRGPSFLHLPLITISLLGVQLFWSVEISYASPYLLSLGLSKSMMAIVFVAGPLSGLVMQPLIGIMADANTSRWGRRRPYMLLGSIVCIMAVLLLGWAKRVASWFSQSDSLVVWLAVSSIYLIDFGINAVQAVDRALIVDILPSASQPAGNAWAARMLGIGSVLGFFIGYLDLPGLFPMFGSTQLQVFSILAAFLLLMTHLVTAFTAHEKVLSPVEEATGDGGLLAKSFTNEVKEIFTNMWTLPRVIRQICIIQFFSWISWFPLLFYTTVYVGDLHKQEFYSTILTNSSNSSINGNFDTKTLDAEATRLGSRALFFSALLTLAANVILPFFVRETKSKVFRGSPYAPNGMQNELSLHNLTPSTSKSTSLLQRLSLLQVHLSTLWAMSQAVFASCMFATFFTKSVTGATIIITITGFSWAVTQWVPFALLAEAILTEPANTDDAASILLTDTRSHRARGSSSFSIRQSSDSRRARDSRTSDIEEAVTAPLAPDSTEELGNPQNKRNKLVLSNRSASADQTQISSSEYGEDDDDGDAGEDAILVSREDDTDSQNIGGLSSKAGIILGIHNIFIVIPQFLVTGLSSVIFALFDPQKSVLHGAHPGNILNAPSDTTSTMVLPRDSQDGGSNSVAYVLRIGGFSALIAFFLCCKLARELRHQ